MTDRWATSDRRSRLPADWPRRVRKVRGRAGGRCEWVDDGRRCGERGTDCDHVDGTDDHSLENLRWLCHPHHEVTTKAQAAAARHRHSRKRPPKPHIGLRRDPPPNESKRSIR